MKTYDKVYNLVRKIPKGKVSTYGQIGQMLGLNPRVVGWALNRLAKNVDRKSPLVSRQATNYEPQSKIHNSRFTSVPWQRVINSKGKISTNKLQEIPLDLQQRILEKEGIVFNKENTTDLKKYLWKRSE